jgi:hypothetical protein
VFADQPLGAVIMQGRRRPYRRPVHRQRHVVKATSAGTIVGMAVPQVVFSGYALIHVARN